MANTVSSLSYANTFGDWMVATNNLVTENNILAKENYIKDTGTLYLSENTQTALQSNGNVIVQKVFSVQGIGSSATIQNNLDVQGQGYFTNGNLSIATTGSANIGKTLYVLGSGNALIVSNNAIVGGNVAISYATITRTLQANNTVNTSYASIVNTIFANKLQANTSTLTDVAVANSSIYTNYLQSNTNILTAALHSNNEITTAAASVTGTTWTNVLQANNSTNTSNATVVWTLTANNVQSNQTVNTSTLSVVNTTHTNVLQANNSTNTSNASIVWTLYANNVQANATVNTTTASITGTTHTDVLQANSAANTRTLSVTGTTHTGVLQANTRANTEVLTVTQTAYVDVLQANSLVNTSSMTVTNGAYSDFLEVSSFANVKTLSVTSTTFTDIMQANSAANTRTMSVTGTTHTNVLQANSSANTRTMSVTGTTHTDVLQANSSANTRTMSVTGTTFTDILIANSYARTVNTWASDTSRANILYANTTTWTPNITVTNLLNASAAEVSAKSLQIEDNLSIGGNFVINGTTVFNSNEFILSQNSPNQISYFNVYRTSNGAANGVLANASIRWNETFDYFDIKNVDTGDYYRIITEQQVSDSTTSTSSILAASSKAANTLNNALQTANTFLKARIDSADSFANGAFARANASYVSQNTTASFANAAFRHANASFDAANNVGPQIAPAFAQANAAFDKANAATSEIKGTTGSISPINASLTLTSNNGMQLYATGANTMAISTAQDIRTTASPTFATVSLSTTPLGPSSGGTGTTSLASAFNALVANATGTQSGTAGYVLATGGTGNFYWTAAPSGGGGGGATPGTRITSTRLSYTGDGTKTLYDTPTFDQANQVRAYINGVRQLESEYTLNSGTSKITFTAAPVNGDRVLIEVDGYTTYAYYANNIAYGPVTGSIPSSANTIQLAIDDIESRKMPKVGGTFTGDVIGLTMPTTTSNTSFATTAFVNNLANSSYTFTHSISGNAGTVTNGLYSTGSYANPTWLTSLSAAKLTLGTIPSTTLGLSTLYVGTTAIALNRGSASQSLTGVSIDGNAGTVGSLSVQAYGSEGRNSSANTIVRTDATGNLFVQAINTSAHDKIAASPVYVMASNNTGTSANVTSYQTAYLSVGYATYAATAGSAPASDVSSWAKAATKPSYAYSELSGLPTIPAAQIQSDWNQASTSALDFIKNKPTIPAAQVQTDWNSTTGLSSILNKPTIPAAYSPPQGIATTSKPQFDGLGIGTAASATAGEIRATNNITAYYSSDKKYKENIQDIPNALEKVDAIGGKLFDWTDEYIKEHGGEDGYFVQKADFGVVAQDVESVFPVATRKKPDGSLAVDYEKLCALAFAAIKELKAEVETLKGQIK